MAYLSDINDQTQQQLGQVAAPAGLNNTAAPIAPAGSGGGAGSTGRSSSPTASPNTASSTTPGTPATNVSTYLQANQPQVQNYGSSITGQLNGQYGQALNDVNSAASNFNTSVNTGYTPVNSSVDQSVLSNPATVTSNPSSTQAFESQLSDAYSGPTQFETSSSYAPLEQEIATTQNSATPWTTFSGTESQFQGLGDTTPGEQQLDATLIQQTPNVAQNIQTAASQASTLTPTINNVAATEDAAVQSAQANASEAQSGATTALNTAEQEEASQLGSELSSAQTAEGTYNSDVSTLQQAATQIQQQITAFLAANPQITAANIDPALAPWVGLQQANAPTQSDVATAQDYSEEAALSELANGNYSSLLSPTDASQAGTYTLPDASVIEGTVSPVAQALNSEVGSIGNQITSQENEFQTAEEEAYDVGTLVPEQSQAQKAVSTDNSTIAALQQQIKSTPTGTGKGTTLPGLQQQLAADQTQLATDQASLDSVNTQVASEVSKTGTPEANWNGWDAVGPLAQSLSYLPQLGTNYNDLIAQLQADVTPLNGISIPSYTQSASPSSPFPQAITPSTSDATSIGKASNLAALGATGAAGVEAGLSASSAAAGNAAEIAAETAANEVGGMGTDAGQQAFAESLAQNTDMLGASTPVTGATPISAGLEGAGEELGPAALAAYGTSNIAQNIAANPVQDLGAILGNTLTLGALSLPKSALSSIGNDINKAVNAVDDFFKHLF